MRAGRWVVEASPGFWTLRSGEKTGGGNPNVDISAQGYTGAFSVKREWTDRWGLGLFGSFASQTGEEAIPSNTSLATIVQLKNLPAGAGGAGGTIRGMNGSVIGLMVTYDFFPNPEGFRMPFSIGPLLVRQGMEFENTAPNPRESLKIDQSDIGAFWNLSGSFLVMKGKLRITQGVFGAVGGSFIRAVEYKTGAATTVQDVGSTNAAPVLYTAFLYRPWGLSFNWNMTELLLGSRVASNSIYSLKWTKKWG